MQGVRKALTPRVVIMMLLVLVVVPLSPLLITGRWGWWEAWVYAILAIGGFIVSRALAARHNPGLLAERARFGDQPDAKPWDKVLSPIVGVGAGLIPIVAGVDVLQGWSAPYSLALKLLGLALLLVGYVWASYALIENAYFSGVVRLQADRGQRVVSSGPYATMRHPGYVGALLAYVGTPLLLDSRRAFVVVAAITVVLVVRTALEDRTLQAELPGYRQYASRVRYRLIPGVW